MFLRLKNRFRPIAHDSYYKLFDNYTNSEYLLDREQYNLLLSLDGSRTFKQLLNEFEKTDRPVVKSFHRELSEIQAIEHLPIIKKRVFPDNYPSPYLESVLWDITSRCNIGCMHCYVSGSSNESEGKDLSLEEVYTTVDEMSSMNIKEVSLTGGEPLMRKDLSKIISYILKSNVRLGALFTNGISVQDDFIEFLIDSIPYPSKFCIRISLDGMTPESNAVIRGNKSDPNNFFYKTINTIKRLAVEGFFISIGTSVHRFNVKEIPEMYSFVKSLGANKWRLAVPKPMGRFQQTQKNIGAEWTEVLRSYYLLIDRHLKEIRIKNNEVVAPLLVGIEQIFSTEITVQTVNKFRKNDLVCFYHKNHCSVKSNGDVIPCGYFDKIIAGNVSREGLKDAWENQTMQRVKNLPVFEITECRDCKLLDFCGTGCRAVAEKINGSIYEKDPYACHQTPFFKETVIQLLKNHGFAIKMSQKCLEFSD